MRANRLAWSSLVVGAGAMVLFAGCDAYIAKPFSPRRLLALVREFLPLQ